VQLIAREYGMFFIKNFLFVLFRIEYKEDIALT